MISERKLVARWFREGSLVKKVFWKQRSVWEPYVHVIKMGRNHPDNGKTFGWRKEIARIFISPKGKEYVRRGPSDPLSLTLRHEGLRDIQFTRLSESAVGRMLAKRDAEQSGRAREETKRKRQKRGARR
jgi:hypothetical protein